MQSTPENVENTEYCVVKPCALRKEYRYNCQSTQLANHFFVELQDSTRRVTKGNCNEIPDLVLGRLWLANDLLVRKWRSPDSKFHNLPLQ